MRSDYELKRQDLDFIRTQDLREAFEGRTVCGLHDLDCLYGPALTVTLEVRPVCSKSIRAFLLTALKVYVKAGRLLVDFVLPSRVVMCTARLGLKAPAWARL
jgi:hypothetical protein